MRESIGSSWIMMIVATFVIIFSCFLSLSVNYAKAFKIKDGIIERIEKNNGFNCEARCSISEYMNTIGYNSKGSCEEFMNENYNYWGVEGLNASNRGTSKSYNYCVQKVYSKNIGVGDSTTDVYDYGASGSYYKVEVFFKISLPIIESVNLFGITGETTYIAAPVEQSANDCTCN